MIHELRGLLAAGRLRLPVLPEAVTRVIAATQRPDADARVLAELVRRDAALAANLLRVANSSWYGRGAPLRTLHQAVCRLGTGALRQIALVVAGEAAAFRIPGQEEAVRTQFRHALVTALFAQEIARMRRGAVEDAFLAGLFHDVGKPVILGAAAELALDPAALGHIVAECHAEIGGAVLAAWSLPSAARLAALHHHDPVPPPAAGVWAPLVALADALAHFAADEADLPEAHPALLPLELYPEDLAALAARKDELCRSAQELA